VGHGSAGCSSAGAPRGARCFKAFICDADEYIQYVHRFVTRISCCNKRIGSSEARFSRVFNVTFKVLVSAIGVQCPFEPNRVTSPWSWSSGAVVARCRGFVSSKRVCCLLVLDSVTSTPQRIRQPKPRDIVHDVCVFVCKCVLGSPRAPQPLNILLCLF
jgi:hypothetical protein